MEFTVTTERLDESAGYIRDKTTQYNNDINKLYSELEAMTSSAWTGVASETYRSKIEGYKGEFEQLRTTLNNFADLLGNEAKNYVSTENNITSAAQSL